MSAKYLTPAIPACRHAGDLATICTHEENVLGYCTSSICPADTNHIDASKNEEASRAETDSNCGSSHYLVLILASYCDECTDHSPCPACLQMSNVGKVSAGALEVVGDFGLVGKYGDGE